MKTFMEEYGLIIIAVVIIAALIILAVNFANRSSASAQNAFNHFDTITNTTLGGAVSNTNSQVPNGNNGN